MQSTQKKHFSFNQSISFKWDFGWNFILKHSFFYPALPQMGYHARMGALPELGNMEQSAGK